MYERGKKMYERCMNDVWRMYEGGKGCMKAEENAVKNVWKRSV